MPKLMSERMMALSPEPRGKYEPSCVPSRPVGTANLVLFGPLRYAFLGLRSIIRSVDAEPYERIWNYHCEIEENNMKERKKLLPLTSPS